MKEGGKKEGGTEGRTKRGRKGRSEQIRGGGEERKWCGVGGKKSGGGAGQERKIGREVGARNQEPFRARLFPLARERPTTGAQATGPATRIASQPATTRQGQGLARQSLSASWQLTPKPPRE